jgi:ArsR family metal-binding transcriptional regulator
MYDVDSYLPLLYRMRYTKQTCMGFEVRKAHMITKIKKCLCLVAFDYTSLKINI